MTEYTSVHARVDLTQYSLKVIRVRQLWYAMISKSYPLVITLHRREHFYYPYPFHYVVEAMFLTPFLHCPLSILFIPFCPFSI